MEKHPDGAAQGGDLRLKVNQSVGEFCVHGRFHRG
jgi:hypothetical protein